MTNWKRERERGSTKSTGSCWPLHKCNHVHYVNLWICIQLYVGPYNCTYQQSLTSCCIFKVHLGWVFIVCLGLTVFRAGSLGTKNWCVQGLIQGSAWGSNDDVTNDDKHGTQCHTNAAGFLLLETLEIFQIHTMYVIPEKLRISSLVSWLHCYNLYCMNKHT